MKLPLAGLLVLAFTSSRSAQEVEPPAEILTQEDARLHGLESLRTAVQNDGGLPQPEDLSTYIRRTRFARALGKALFYDMAIGSDGIQACATCHFHAGGDSRPTNQLNPGLLRVLDASQGAVVGFHGAAPVPDERFEIGGPNSTLAHADFPFVRDIGDGANVIDVGGVLEPAPGNSNDVASSMGVRLTEFVSVAAGDSVDAGNPLDDPIFNVDGVTIRRVEPRNTPTVINAVFNFHNFWDGRANHFFNGVDPFGKTNPAARIFKLSTGALTPGGLREDPTITTEAIALENASLASQAVGPPLSAFEMSWDGRQWRHIGRKVLTRRALALQEVHVEDSLLGGLRDASGTGLTLTYQQLIERTFASNLWQSDEMIYFPPDGGPAQIVAAGTTDPEDTFTMMEANFAFFFGMAVMAYEANLVADRSPFDQWMESNRRFVAGFGPAELSGLNVFVGKGKCVNCHGGPELTNASVRNAQRGQNIIEPMLMADRQPAMYDNGYYNIGVTPTVDDIGRGGQGPGEHPLASSRQILFEALGIMDIPFPIIGSPIPNLVPDVLDPSILGFIEEGTTDFFPVCRDLDGDGQCGEADEFLLQRNAVDGAFKTPGLRNIALTGPFMHNGSLATLMEVVEFYDRGGNFCRLNCDNLDPDITPLELTDTEKLDLVSFLESLTDRRVSFKRAPFDHPQFFIPQGHAPDGTTILAELPAVGRRGLPDLADELGPFLDLDQTLANPVTGNTDENGDVRCSAKELPEEAEPIE